MRIGRRLAVIGVGVALATAFSAPVALVAADASVHAAASCGGEEEENGTPVGVVHSSKRYVYPGAEFNIFADCFTAGEVVDISYCGSSLGTTEADSQGRASAEVTIPEHACARQCGRHTITMTGEASGYRAVGTLETLCAVASAAGGPPPAHHGGGPGVAGPTVEATGAQQPPAALPFTGAPTAPLSLTGTALVAAGAMLTVAARRRYAARHALD